MSQDTIIKDKDGRTIIIEGFYADLQGIWRLYQDYDQLSIRPRVAVVGQNGAGKSTFINNLLQLWPRFPAGQSLAVAGHGRTGPYGRSAKPRFVDWEVQGDLSVSEQKALDSIVFDGGDAKEPQPNGTPNARYYLLPEGVIKHTTLLQETGIDDGHLSFKAEYVKPSLVLRWQNSTQEHLAQQQEQITTSLSSIPPEVTRFLQLKGYPDRSDHEAVLQDMRQSGVAVPIWMKPLLDRCRAFCPDPAKPLARQQQDVRNFSSRYIRWQGETTAADEQYNTPGYGNRYIHMMQSVKFSCPSGIPVQLLDMVGDGSRRLGGPLEVSGTADGLAADGLIIVVAFARDNDQAYVLAHLKALETKGALEPLLLEATAAAAGATCHAANPAAAGSSAQAAAASDPQSQPPWLQPTLSVVLLGDKAFAEPMRQLREAEAEVKQLQEQLQQQQPADTSAGHHMDTDAADDTAADKLDRWDHPYPTSLYDSYSDMEDNNPAQELQERLDAAQEAQRACAAQLAQDQQAANNILFNTVESVVQQSVRSKLQAQGMLHANAGLTAEQQKAVGRVITKNVHTFTVYLSQLVRELERADSCTNQTAAAAEVGGTPTQPMTPAQAGLPDMQAFFSSVCRRHHEHQQHRQPTSILKLQAEAQLQVKLQELRMDSCPVELSSQHAAVVLKQLLEDMLQKLDKLKHDLQEDSPHMQHVEQQLAIQLKGSLSQTAKSCTPPEFISALFSLLGPSLGEDAVSILDECKAGLQDARCYEDLPARLQRLLYEGKNKDLTTKWSRLKGHISALLEHGVATVPNTKDIHVCSDISLVELLFAPVYKLLGPTGPPPPACLHSSNHRNLLVACSTAEDSSAQPQQTGTSPPSAAGAVGQCAATAVIRKCARSVQLTDEHMQETALCTAGMLLRGSEDTSSGSSSTGSTSADAQQVEQLASKCLQLLHSVHRSVQYVATVQLQKRLQPLLDFQQTFQRQILSQVGHQLSRTIRSEVCDIYNTQDMKVAGKFTALEAWLTDSGQDKLLEHYSSIGASEIARQLRSFIEAVEAAVTWARERTIASPELLPLMCKDNTLQHRLQEALAIEAELAVLEWSGSLQRTGCSSQGDPAFTGQTSAAAAAAAGHAPSRRQAAETRLPQGSCESRLQCLLKDTFQEALNLQDSNTRPELFFNHYFLTQQQLPRLIIPMATFKSWVTYLASQGYDSMPAEVPPDDWRRWRRLNPVCSGSCASVQLHVFGLPGVINTQGSPVEVDSRKVMLLNQLIWQVLIGDACSLQQGSMLANILEAAEELQRAEEVAAAAGNAAAAVPPLQHNESFVLHIMRAALMGVPFAPVEVFTNAQSLQNYLDVLMEVHGHGQLCPISSVPAGTWLVGRRPANLAVQDCPAGSPEASASSTAATQQRPAQAKEFGQLVEYNEAAQTWTVEWYCSLDAASKDHQADAAAAEEEEQPAPAFRPLGECPLGGRQEADAVQLKPPRTVELTVAQVNDIRTDVHTAQGLDALLAAGSNAHRVQIFRTIADFKTALARICQLLKSRGLAEDCLGIKQLLEGIEGYTGLDESWTVHTLPQGSRRSFNRQISYCFYGQLDPETRKPLQYVEGQTVRSNVPIIFQGLDPALKFIQTGQLPQPSRKSGTTPQKKQEYLRNRIRAHINALRELRGRHNSPVSTLPELQEPSEPPAVPAQPAKRRAAAQSSDHRPTKQQKTPPPPAAASGNSHVAAAVATAAAAAAAGRASTSPSAAAAAGPRTRSQGAADAVEELGPNRRSWLQLTFEELHDAEKGVIEGVECVKVWKFGTRQQYEREICVTPSGSIEYGGISYSRPMDLVAAVMREDYLLRVCKHGSILQDCNRGCADQNFKESAYTNLWLDDGRMLAEVREAYYDKHGLKKPTHS